MVQEPCCFHVPISSPSPSQLLLPCFLSSGTKAPKRVIQWHYLGTPIGDALRATLIGVLKECQNVCGMSHDPIVAFLLDYYNLQGCLRSANTGSSNIVVVESEEQFKRSLRKVQDESLSAIFYYTAVWCSPCRLLSPVIKQLSEKYPHVTTYKVDIDHKGLGNALSNMDIHSVPTVHLFRNGIKANEVIGADVQLLKNIMEKLYK